MTYLGKLSNDLSILDCQYYDEKIGDDPEDGDTL